MRAARAFRHPRPSFPRLPERARDPILTPHSKPASAPATPEDLPLGKSGELKLTWGLALQVLLGMAVGAFGSYQLLRGGFKWAPQGTNQLLMLGVVVTGFGIAMLGNLLVHELGHALAGQAMGGSIVRLVIGPWRYERFRSGYRWRKVRALAGIGGFVQSVLPADARLRHSTTVMLLGGPLSNLLLAALAFGLTHSFDLHWAVRLCLIEVAVFGAILGFVNLLPFRMQGFLTDGAQLFRLWTQADAFARAQLTARIARASIDGLRAREIADADVATLDPQHANPNDRFLALLLRSAVLADRGDLLAARASIDIALGDWDKLPDGFRQLLAISAANLAAQIDRDPERARAWLERAEGGLIEDYQYAEVRARIADLEGDPVTRDVSIEHLRQAVDDSIYLGDAKSYRDKLAKWDQERVL